MLARETVAGFEVAVEQAQGYKVHPCAEFVQRAAGGLLGLGGDILQAFVEHQIVADIGAVMRCILRHAVELFEVFDAVNGLRGVGFEFNGDEFFQFAGAGFAGAGEEEKAQA